MDSGISWTDNESRCYVSTDDSNLIKFFRKRIGMYSEDVHILREPEVNDGCLYFNCPASWGKRAFKHLFPMNRKPMSDEQKRKLADGLKKWKDRAENESDDEQ